MDTHSIRRAAACCATLLALMTGCASDVEYGTTYDPLTAFPATATFEWDAKANVLPKDPRLEKLDLGGIIEKVAAEEFAARGYGEAAVGSGNFRLSYQVAVNTWVGAEDSFAVGSLSLQLVDAASKRRVWTGFGRADFDIALSHAQREQRLREAIQTMLEEFPPSQPKS
jgi:hypothetical protein